MPERPELDLQAALSTRRAPDLSRTKAIVLAGGRGTRLAPLTSILPKPLMPIGDRSILEIVVQQLAASGVRDVTLCTGYLSHLIRAVFDNGPGHGLEIAYVAEQTPLGTAAPLRRVPGLDATFIVMNGDVLTALDHRDVVAHHVEAGNALTIAAHRRVVKVDYGVLHHEDDGGGERLVAFDEKPELPFSVSMGIYVMEPEMIGLIPEERPFDFPDLVKAALDVGYRVGVYPYEGLWFDIGRHDDYELAAETWMAQHTEDLPAPRQLREAVEDQPARNSETRRASSSSV